MARTHQARRPKIERLRPLGRGVRYRVGRREYYADADRSFRIITGGTREKHRK
jgi:hypothetical protein